MNINTLVGLCACVWVLTYHFRIIGIELNLFLIGLVPSSSVSAFSGLLSQTLTPVCVFLNVFFSFNNPYRILSNGLGMAFHMEVGIFVAIGDFLHFDSQCL